MLCYSRNNITPEWNRVENWLVPNIECNAPENTFRKVKFVEERKTTTNLYSVVGGSIRQRPHGACIADPQPAVHDPWFGLAHYHVNNSSPTPLPLYEWLAIQGRTLQNKCYVYRKILVLFGTAKSNSDHAHFNKIILYTIDFVRVHI